MSKDWFMEVKFKKYHDYRDLVYEVITKILTQRQVVLDYTDVDGSGMIIVISCGDGLYHQFEIGNKYKLSSEDWEDSTILQMDLVKDDIK